MVSYDSTSPTDVKEEFINANTSEQANSRTTELDVVDDLVISKLTKSELQSTKPKTRAEKEVIRKRKYHQRKKNELTSLRELVYALSSQLEALQQLSNDSNWRDIALRQRFQRQTVEAEQMQLFASAKMQAMFIDKLCEQLPRIMKSRLMIEDPHCSAKHYQLFDNKYQFRSHVESVKACYTKVDDILCEFNNSQNGVTSSICYREKDGEVKYFQHLNRFIQPYNYEKTHQTMWKLAKLLHRQQDRQDFDDLGSPGDTVVIKFRLVRTLKSGVPVSVQQRYVHRRFMEINRTVLIWKTLSEGEGAFTGMHAEETGWVCLQPATEENSTLVRVCVRQAPMRYGNLSSNESTFYEFHQVLQSSVGEDMLEISTALDRMLLDDTLEGIDI
ncbi:hypothetical protein PHMEG_00025251 [Phytophthora megakarya]|uniref:M96 mating-specific protein n=1 Tax=Phytophthora megakarya TaxID=4795 RepID=A0A225VC43_9STRA|nr:hypothetical protein PHMEG_00025251 [Phytophthora megakarya]